MGNICPCLKRRKEKQLPYDVHEQSFQIEEHPNLGLHSPHNQHHDHQINVLSEDLRTSEQGHVKVPNQQANRHENHYLQTLSEKQLDKKEQKFSQLNRAEKQPVVEQQSVVKSEQPKQKIDQKPNFNPNILKPKSIKKKVNPDDYRFINENQKFRVKKIDSIKQQQFNIDNCKQCTYFIFDITANLYIDDSQNCFIFVAPCQSTVFLRNCKNLVVVAATKQFRTYQVHNSTFSLYCKSQPVIESSSQLVFAPFSCPFYYGELLNQLSKKKMQPWNNHWSQVHDFTKKQGQQHYQLQQNIIFNQIHWLQAFQEAELVKAQIQNPMPFIVGQLPYEIKNEVLILINQGVDDQIVRNALKGAVIVKSFQGFIAGEGKQQRKALLIDAVDNSTQQFEDFSIVFRDKQQINTRKQKLFVNFSDERQK